MASIINYPLNPLLTIASFSISTSWRHRVMLLPNASINNWWSQPSIDLKNERRNIMKKNQDIIKICYNQHYWVPEMCWIYNWFAFYVHLEIPVKLFFNQYYFLSVISFTFIAGAKKFMLLFHRVLPIVYKSNTYLHFWELN